MKVLVAFASRHGSTHEIADAVAEELGASGLEVDPREAGEVTDIGDYGAVVLGSAVYRGKWLPPALQFIERHRARLANLPVWLFSSGPVGEEQLQPTGEPDNLRELLEATRARDHQVFSGKLESGGLGLRERLAVRMAGTPRGDYREWQKVRAWARNIAASLRGRKPAG
ncbi:MAG: flavodoxin domain-containing protein [Chloroflexota bacterium]